MLEIITGGALSLIQDCGRCGVMKNGFTQSGAIDRQAYELANSLLGNEPGAPAIEMTAKGLTAWFDKETLFCITGGIFDAKLNDRPLENNRVYRAVKDDIISIGNAKKGLRCYLAVSGGFLVRKTLGSASTDMKSGIGGIEGRKLRSYDKIDYGAPLPVSEEGKSAKRIALFPDTIEVRAVPGPQDDMFSDETLAVFFSDEFTVSPALDRMGIRLDGPEIKGKDGCDIISDGIVFGSVQIPNSGSPIILMADHQTTGGYAKIATVISADLPKLAQARPGNKIRFIKVTVEEAEEAAIAGPQEPVCNYRITEV